MKIIKEKKYTVVIINGVLAEAEKDGTVKTLVKKLESFLSALTGDIYLITHSSGPEIVMRAKLPSTVKAWALWSPALLYPQNITATLLTAGKYFIYEKKHISRRIAMEMDLMDTAKFIPKISIPIHLYISKEGSGWTNQSIIKTLPKGTCRTKIPYSHNYSQGEQKEIYKKTLYWFNGLR
jgi:hypothetical protein